MRLKKLDIQAYRSLYEVGLAPQSFSVLVGPNNAGKTNLADSFEFLGQVARNGLEVAVSREGGFENFAFRRARRTRRPVRFSFEADIEGGDLSRSYGKRDVRFRRKKAEQFKLAVTYSFELTASSESRDADFRVTREHLTLSATGPDKAFVQLERLEEQISLSSNRPVSDPPLGDRPSTLDWLLDPLTNESFARYLEQIVDPTALVLNRLAFNVVLADLLEDLGRTRIFQLTPVECRKPGSSTPNPELERHGGNLPAVVRYMQRNEPAAWDATVQAMQGIVPGLTEIETEFTTGRRLALLFHEKGARAWTSEEVSDGTIQSLALFTCLFDPRVPLVLIEEPENSVHPWIVKTFVDACRSVERKQVLLTSHSPALISYLRPSELDIVWRGDDGRTRVCPLEGLDPEAPKLWERGELDLYELIDGGWIRESVPPGLQ